MQLLDLNAKMCAHQEHAFFRARVHLCRLQLVAEEDSADLRQAGAKEMLSTIATLVTQALQSAYPGCPELSSDDILDLIDLGDSPAGPSGQHWVLDPIDGTRGFEVRPRKQQEGCELSCHDFVAMCAARQSCKA